MPAMRTAVLRALAPALSAALVIGGIDIPHAKVSPTSRALEDQTYPDKWPFDARDLTPQGASGGAEDELDPAQLRQVIAAQRRVAERLAEAIERQSTLQNLIAERQQSSGCTN